MSVQIKSRGFSIRMMASIAFVVLAARQAANGQDQASDATWQRYLHVLRTSTLEWLTSEPFRLKVDYQLYDLGGKPLEKGTAEESWGEDLKYLHVESPTLSIGDTVPVDEYRIHTRESYLVHQAVSALARPFPSVSQYKDSGAVDFNQTVGSSDLGCFSIVPRGAPRTAETRGYCTDADNHLVAITGPLFVFERSNFREFRGHQIPLDLKLSYEGKPALTMHVTELEPQPPVPTSKTQAKTTSATLRVPNDILAARILKKKNPAYPKFAKAAHISGSVLITAIITKQGTIAGMDVIASPDPLLTKSAEDAVQTWTYEPYLLNGIPSEVDTTITVNFNFGR